MTTDNQNNLQDKNKRLEKLVYIGLAVAVIAAVSTALGALPRLKIFQSEQAYICTKKLDKHDNRNITMIEKGIFSKTCISYEKRKPKIMKGDCGQRLSFFIKKGFSCKKTGLDLD